MKKILFLINSLKAGGAEKVLVDTVNSLDPNKYQITVQTLLDTGENKQYLSSHVRYKTIVRAKNAFVRRVLINLLLKVLRADLVYRFFIKEDYDYEIAFLEGQPTKIISKSTNLKSKKYAWVHIDLNAFPNSIYAYGTPEREEAAYRCFDKVICVSEAVKKEFLNKYPIDERRVDVLYNIIDDREICSASMDSVELPDMPKPMLISVGRLARQKGYDRLLRIHRRLIQEGLVHSLVLIGDGDLREELTSFVQQSGLSDTVRFLGYQSNPHKYVSKADLFVCSSYAEGYSTVVSEAVLCNTPVLSTNVAGSSEPAECPRCSIIVENSEDALYEAIKSLLEDPEKLTALYVDLEQRKTALKKDNLISAFEQKLF